MPKYQSRDEVIDDAPELLWSSYHLYYHEDLSRAILEFVYPTVAVLLQDCQIDSFFFVRFGLGGPHLRLRLRTSPEQIAKVSSLVQGRADRFLSYSPSTRSVDAEVIRRQNQVILASDPHELDDSVYPDNTFLTCPFHPDIQRYGGLEFLPPSLDFFAISSVEALLFTLRHRGGSRSDQLTEAFRLMLQQAIGFALDDEELLSIVKYGVATWGESFPALMAKGDRVHASQREVFQTIAWQEQAARHNPERATMCRLAEAACGLSFLLGSRDRALRRRVGISQLHMTVTRLGLNNLEEAYLSRLLSRTAEEISLVPDLGTHTPLHETLTGALATLSRSYLHAAAVH